LEIDLTARNEVEVCGANERVVKLDLFDFRFILTSSNLFLHF